MPTLLEVQQAIRRSLVGRDDRDAVRHLRGNGLPPAARLSIYRNTFAGGLTTALRLSFPAVHHLVGADFFESAARIFIERAPPRSAWLDEYGAGFPEFLASFAPAASLPYLPGVARLEWAVGRALHAPDTAPLDIARLAEVAPEDQGTVAFVPHPSVALVQADYPVDEIWRAVLDRDAAAMAAIDLAAGPVWLLVERRAGDVMVTPCSEPAWRFAAELIGSRPLQVAIATVPEVEAPILLADHLARGRFIAFTFDPPGAAPAPEEFSCQPTIQRLRTAPCHPPRS